LHPLQADNKSIFFGVLNIECFDFSLRFLKAFTPIARFACWELASRWPSYRRQSANGDFSSAQASRLDLRQA
jgi:hypothetical protein